MPKRAWWDVGLDIFVILFNIFITVMGHSIINLIFTVVFTYYIVVIKKTKWDRLRLEYKGGEDE